MKRVVVTGIGIISCLGNNQKEVSDSQMNTKSAISFSSASIIACGVGYLLNNSCLTVSIVVRLQRFNMIQQQSIFQGSSW